MSIDYSKLPKNPLVHLTPAEIEFSKEHGLTMGEVIFCIYWVAGK